MFSEYIIYRSLLHPQVLKWTCSFLSSSVVSATSWGHLDYIIILKQTNKQRTKGESSLKHTMPFTNEKGFLTPSVYHSHEWFKRIWGRAEKPKYHEGKNGLEFKWQWATLGISVGDWLLPILLSSDYSNH